MSQMDRNIDFTKYGYQLIKKLGENQEHSTITWQAIDLEKDIPVAIEQFCFGRDNSSWFGYQLYQQQMKLLKQIKHPSIPQYIGEIETENSFCFVREYIEATALAQLQNLQKLTIQDLKKISINTLTTLRHLQEKNPTILHLNLTPDNILVDKNLNIYLINFSVENQIESEINHLTIADRNVDYIAPERYLKPVPASDIYSLGWVLKTLVKQQKIPLDTSFQEWLDISTNLEPTERYPDAESAIAGLKKLSWDGVEIAEQTTQLPTLSTKAYTSGLVTMAILGTAISYGFNISQQVTEKSLINITIALMAMGIVYITQSASLTIVTNDSREQKQSLFLAIATPLLIATVTGFIFGRGEAVAVSFVTTLAQTIILISVLLKKLPLEQPNNTIKGISFLIAIALGLIGGTVIS